MRALITASALALMAAPAVAGDFTGAYAGAQVGFSDVNTSSGLDGSRFTYGLHAGYDHDFGDWVVGGGIQLDRLNLSTSSGGVKFDSINRAIIKVGYDFGTMYGYGIAGAAQGNTSIGDDTAGVFGVGINFQTGYNFDTAVEILYHDFSELGSSGVGSDVTTFNLLVSYNF